MQQTRCLEERYFAAQHVRTELLLIPPTACTVLGECGSPCYSLSAGISKVGRSRDTQLVLYVVCGGYVQICYGLFVSCLGNHAMLRQCYSDSASSLNCYCYCCRHGILDKTPVQIARWKTPVTSDVMHLFSHKPEAFIRVPHLYAAAVHLLIHFCWLARLQSPHSLVAWESACIQMPLFVSFIWNVDDALEFCHTVLLQRCIYVPSCSFFRRAIPPLANKH